MIDYSATCNHIILWTLPSTWQPLNKCYGAQYYNYNHYVKIYMFCIKVHYVLIKKCEQCDHCSILNMFIFISIQSSINNFYWELLVINKLIISYSSRIFGKSSTKVISIPVLLSVSIFSVSLERETVWWECLHGTHIPGLFAAHHSLFMWHFVSHE